MLASVSSNLDRELDFPIQGYLRERKCMQISIPNDNRERDVTVIIKNGGRDALRGGNCGIRAPDCVKNREKS